MSGLTEVVAEAEPFRTARRGIKLETSIPKGTPRTEFLSAPRLIEIKQGH